MAITDINTLKSWFKKGLKPKESQFATWMDSFWHKNETIAMANINGLNASLNEKASKQELTDMNAKFGTIRPSATLYVDTAYTGGNSNGSILQPFTKLQDAINAAPLSGAYTRIVCAPRQSLGDITVDRAVIIQTMGDSAGFSLTKVGNVTITTPNAWLMDIEVAGTVRFNRVGLLFIDRCSLKDNIILSGGNEVRINYSKFALNKGVHVSTNANGVSYITACGVNGMSIMADNTQVDATRCEFRTSVENDPADASGVILTNAQSASFGACSFGAYNVANPNQLLPVKVKYTPSGNNTAKFINCQINESIVDNDKCIVSDIVIKHIAHFYLANRTLEGHIESIDMAFKMLNVYDFYPSSYRPNGEMLRDHLEGTY